MDERIAIGLRWAIGAIAAVLVVELAVAAQQVLGGFDSNALRGFSQPVSWLIHQTMIDSVRRRADGIEPPARFTEAEVRAGFRLYEQRCVMCHGAPGVGRQAWVAGLHPTPPYLLDAAKHWRARDLDYIIANGVKMTGMPAWAPTLSSGDIWDLVAFLEVLPNTTATDYARSRSDTQTSVPSAQN